jgi:radical SAM protein with 4Fe4S-binding SPASM domain
MTFSKEDSILMLRAVENIRLLIEDYRSLMKEHPHHDKLLPQLAFQIVNTRSADVQDFPQYVKDFVKEFPGKGLLKRKFLDSWAGQHLAGYDIFAQPVPEVRTPCAEPFNRVAVLVNGDVVPCCRDARGKYIYGNLTNERLDQIWNSERVVKLRQLMIDSLHDQLPEPCRTCREWHIPMDRHIATVDGSDEGVSNA